jgi:soluble lytic murein transglycosylase-like protein
MKLALLLLTGCLWGQAPPAAAAKPNVPSAPTSGELQRGAMAKQIAAAQIQAAQAGQRLKPWGPAPPPSTAGEPECDPIDEKVVSPILESAAKAQAVDPKLLRAVLEQESAYRACAVSIRGAEGLMQLMPDTAARFGVHDAFDPQENVTAGAHYLKELLEKYAGDLPKALSAYNAGASAVDQAGGTPDIQETKDYVDAILKKLAPKP